METPGYKHLRIVLKCKTSLNIHFLRVSPAEGGEWGSAGESKWTRPLELTAVINSGMQSAQPGSCGHFTPQKWARKRNHFLIFHFDQVWATGQKRGLELKVLITTAPHKSLNRAEIRRISPIRGKNLDLHTRNSRLEEQTRQSDKNRENAGFSAGRGRS